MAKTTRCNNQGQPLILINSIFNNRWLSLFWGEISCYRVDEDAIPDRIDNKIYSYLLRAAFIIAEVTTCNPNVFYELGLAHMLEKDCIILTQKSVSEIPFDIGRIRTEKYDNDNHLLGILRKSISALSFKIRQVENI